jgi:hypothetical protein
MRSNKSKQIAPRDLFAKNSSDLFFKLAASLLSTRTSKTYRSHFYRHKHLLDQQMSSILQQHWLSHPDSKHLCEILSEFAPLKSHDIPKPLRAKFDEWHSRFPQDSQFFKDSLNFFNHQQSQSHLSVRDFLLSPSGRKWFQDRRRLQRKASHPWDRPFKASKRNSLKRRLLVQQLLRAYPFLSLEDLKSLAIPNAQEQWERFPFRVHYRQQALDEVKKFWTQLQRANKID